MFHLQEFLAHVNMVLHQTVIEMDKSQMSIYSSKLKGLLNKQLSKDKLNGIYSVHAPKLFVVE